MVRVSQQRAAMGPDFNQLSGEDATASRLHGAWRPRLHLGDLECGAAAVRRVPGAPASKGDYAAALKLQDKLMPLHQHLFVETNPAPAKVRALGARQVRRDGAAADGAAVADKSKAAVRDAMVHAGLIN